MADPTTYTVSYSFAGFQANAPTTPLPGSSLDNELAGIQTSISSLISSVKDVRSSNGGLKNGIVTLDSMSLGVIAALLSLDQDAAAALDNQIAIIESNLAADIAEFDAGKADLSHTHAATDVTVSAISGITETVLQAVLAELRALGPQTGDFMLSLNSTARSGWLPCNDGTIGDATSGATTRANADTLALYTVIWNEVSNTYAPVTSGRGVSAAADFAAHKPIALTKMLGRALAVAGAGSGLASRNLGQYVGAESQTLSIAQLPVVTPTIASLTGYVSAMNMISGINVASIVNGSGTTGVIRSDSINKSDNALHTASGTINSFGSGNAHDNMQPTSFLHAFLKL